MVPGLGVLGHQLAKEVTEFAGKVAILGQSRGVAFCDAVDVAKRRGALRVAVVVQPRSKTWSATATGREPSVGSMHDTHTLSISTLNVRVGASGHFHEHNAKAPNVGGVLVALVLHALRGEVLEGADKGLAHDWRVEGGATRATQ